MTDDDTRCFEMFERVDTLGDEEAASFSFNTFIMGLYANLKQVIAELRASANAQSSGRTNAQQFTQNKAASRERLLRIMSAISRTARSMSTSVPGLEKKFRFTQDLKDQDLLTTARMFAADALPLKAEFIKRGMKEDFLDELEAEIEAFEQALSQRTEQTQTQVSATATIDDLIERGMKIVRELDPIMRNIFEDNPGKLAAWLSASRVERAPHRKKPAPNSAPTT